MKIQFRLLNYNIRFTVKRVIMASAGYQQRHREQGLCIHCPNPVLRRKNGKVYSLCRTCRGKTRARAVKNGKVFTRCQRQKLKKIKRLKSEISFLKTAVKRALLLKQNVI